MNVKIIKLITGEEILAEVVSSDDTSVTLENTIAVVLAPSDDGKNLGFRFIPWGTMVDGDITIGTDKIIYSEPVKDDLKNTYSSMFGGIVTPPKQLIV
jgi:hypothetical protein